MAAHQAIQAGMVGDIISVEAFGHSRSSLLVDSTHTVDLVRSFLGDPRGAGVIGQIDTAEHRSAWGQQIEDCAVALVGFESGGHLTLGTGSIAGDTPDDRISISPPPIPGGTYHRIVIHGTKGRLAIDGDRPHDGHPLVHLHRGDDVEVIFSAEDFTCDPGFSAVTSEVAAMIDCLQLPSMRHPLEARSARDTLEILIASYESSRPSAAPSAVRSPQRTTHSSPCSLSASSGKNLHWHSPRHEDPICS